MDHEDSQALPNMNFSTFVMGLVSAALIELGLVEDPSSGKKRCRVDFAKQHIEMLKILEEKTRGNLSSDEKTLLERALTDLKLQFAKAMEEEKGKKGSKQ